MNLGNKDRYSLTIVSHLRNITYSYYFSLVKAVITIEVFSPPVITRSYLCGWWALPPLAAKPITHTILANCQRLFWPPLERTSQWPAIFCKSLCRSGEMWYTSKRAANTHQLKLCWRMKTVVNYRMRYCTCPGVHRGNVGSSALCERCGVRFYRQQ